MRQSVEQRREEQQIQKAKALLDKNMSDFQAEMRKLDISLIYQNVPEVAAMQGAYSFMMKEYSFQPGDADVLLHMENPLKFVADLWPIGVVQLLDMREFIGENLAKAGKSLTPQRGKKLPVKDSALPEKVSVRDRLRDAVREAGQRPPLEGKAKGGDAR